MVGIGASALRGLRLVLNELPPNADVPAQNLAALVGLIDDLVEPAADRLQNYVPRDGAPSRG